MSYYVKQNYFKDVYISYIGDMFLCYTIYTDPS